MVVPGYRHLKSFRPDKGTAHKPLSSEFLEYLGYKKGDEVQLTLHSEEKSFEIINGKPKAKTVVRVSEKKSFIFTDDLFLEEWQHITNKEMPLLYIVKKHTTPYPTFLVMGSFPKNVDQPA